MNTDDQIRDLKLTIMRMQTEFNVLRRAVSQMRPHLFPDEQEGGGSTPSSGDFTVKVLYDGAGGDALGDSTHAPVVRYTVMLLDGTVIGTHVPITGHGQRIAQATITPGTWGTAYYDSEGTLFLKWVDDVYYTVECDNTGGV